MASHRASSAVRTLQNSKDLLDAIFPMSHPPCIHYPLCRARARPTSVAIFLPSCRGGERGSLHNTRHARERRRCDAKHDATLTVVFVSRNDRSAGSCSCPRGRPSCLSDGAQRLSQKEGRGAPNCQNPETHFLLLFFFWAKKTAPFVSASTGKREREGEGERERRTRGKEAKAVGV